MSRQPKSLLVPEDYNLYLKDSSGGLLIFTAQHASQNGSIPHINPSIEATSKSCLLMLMVAVFLFLLRKSKNGRAIPKEQAINGPGLRFVFVLYENGTVSDWHESRDLKQSRRRAEWTTAGSVLTFTGEKCLRMLCKK